MAKYVTQVGVPELEYEFHTITVDTSGQSANTFTVHLQQPLRNVVQARLLAAHIHANVQVEHCYVSITELNTNFNDRAFKDLSDASEASKANVRGAFASIVSESSSHDAGSQLFLFRDNYPCAVQYVNPIRSIDRLTCTLYDQDGNTIKDPDTASDNYLVIRFTCMKQNI